MSTPTKFPTMTQDAVIASLAERAGMKHVILTEGAARAGQRISDRFRKALPALPESNANTLAAIIETELGIPVLLAERDTLQAENTRLREALEMTIGFCVVFREDVADWQRFPQVGILFSKVTAALAAGKGETR